MILSFLGKVPNRCCAARRFRSSTFVRSVCAGEPPRRGRAGNGGRQMYRRVLVPLDGSLVAEGIIPFIMEIAGPLDMQVVLVRVLVPVPPMAVEGTRQVVIEDFEKRRVEAEEFLWARPRELRAKGCRATPEVRRGEPVAEILAGARDAEADL